MSHCELSMMSSIFKHEGIVLVLLLEHILIEEYLYNVYDVVSKERKRSCNPEEIIRSD